MEDVDTINTQILTESLDDLKGREKIIINASLEEFISNPIEILRKNIGKINAIREKNNLEINYLIKYKKGISSILDKTRPDGSSTNNIFISNFAYEFVEFKKGFTVGKPIKYVNTSDEKDDSMKFFNKYLMKVNKKSKDLDKYENLYTYGIAHTFIKYNPNKYDSEKDSPFIYEVIDSRNACCVYSSDILNTKLFSMYVSKINRDNVSENIYTVYYGKKSLIFKVSNDDIEIIDGIKDEPIDDPITEYQLNQDRMGVFEPVLSSLKSMNFVRSNQLDDIQDFVNSYMIFVNQDAKYIINNIEDFKKNKIFCIKTNNEKAPADVKLLKQSLEHSDINQLYNDIKQDTFNQVGVPMATSNTGQGVSGEAQTYGGGWENAQAIANIQTTYISRYEREDLSKIISICKNAKNPKVKDIDDTDIEIKYTINKSNNILTKMQSFKYWVDLGGSYERGLEICDLSEDSHTVGVETEKNNIERQKQNLELELEKEKQMLALKQENVDINSDEN